MLAEAMIITAIVLFAASIGYMVYMFGKGN
jgi:biopolymer transport protein ExbB/TolQ